LSVLLDTHVWLGWLLAEGSLGRAERDALDLLAERRELSIAAISIWEAQMLHAKGRIQLPLPLATWLPEAVAVVDVLPLHVEVVLTLDALPSTFHGDPADRMIVATARAHHLALATHDRLIRRARLTRLWSPGA
jgi:PIN domain nuclease of toxin-antitoxin system